MTESSEEMNAARTRLWQEWMQKETDRWESYTRRLWEDGRPKEPTVIAQDAIEWDVLPTDDKSAEDGD